MEVEGSRHEADNDRHCGDKEEWQRTLQRDDTMQERGRDTGQPEQTERALPVALPGDDVHRETAGGDDEAGNDDRGHITRQGSNLVRWAAIEAVARYHGGAPIEPTFQRVAKRRGIMIARVAAARKLLSLVYYGLRDGEIRCLAREAS